MQQVRSVANEARMGEFKFARLGVVRPREAVLAQLSPEVGKGGNVDEARIRPVDKQLELLVVILNND